MSFIWLPSFTQSAWSELPMLLGKHIRESSCIGRGWPRWPTGYSSLMCLVVLEANTWARYSSAKSSCTDRAMWDVSTLGWSSVEMWDEDASKIWPFLQKELSLLWAPLGTPKHFGRTSGINLSLDKEMERRLQWPSEWWNQTQVGINSFFHILYVPCGCLLWDHLFSCLYELACRYLTLKFWLEDLTPPFVPLETGSCCLCS